MLVVLEPVNPRPDDVSPLGFGHEQRMAAEAAG
jgi:hypothetical protein